MAGAGYKLFNTGDVLTAAQVNTYLQEQAVMRFATTAARTTALAGVLSEGMVSYIDATDTVEVYNGSAWVSVGGSTSPLTTKGDLYTYSTTNARLGVGTNGQVLTADSTAATGLKWATSSALPTGFTLLNAGGTTLTCATTITVSGLSAKELLIYVEAGSSLSVSSNFRIRFNSDSNANYTYGGMVVGPPATYLDSMAYGEGSTYSGSTFLPLGRMGNAASAEVYAMVYIDKTDTTGWKRFAITGGGNGNQPLTYSHQGFYEASAAITSVSIISSSGNFDQGTVYVLGAN
jgi:hypothetical protein